MNLKELKAAANEYLDGKAGQDEFCDAVLAYIETATPSDYEAFALWIVEQEKRH